MVGMQHQGVCVWWGEACGLERKGRIIYGKEAI